jgi:hypothetical protein
MTEASNERFNAINSSSDFGKFLLGIDEVTHSTTDVVLVEGFTDKAKVDIAINAYSSDRIKCCSSFGKKVSRDQLSILKKKGVKRLHFMYDPDAFYDMKKVVIHACNYFSVGAIIVKGGDDVDPGSMSYEEINSCIADEITAQEYYFSIK